MIGSEQVEHVIYGALRNLNAERPEEPAVPLEPTTVLFGPDSMLDSLALVSTIVDVETGLNTKYGLGICLTDDRAMSRKKSPYATVASLRDYVLELVGGHG
jgi:hypothetical protein